MRILVIGGTGVISTAVTQELIHRGAEVTLFNRGHTPVRFKGQTDLLTGDRTDRPAFEESIRGAGPWDCVIDMICSDPEDARALGRACRGAAEQVIFCSTTNVYPKPADSYPVREDHRLGAAFKNGIDKIQCETIHREAETNGDFHVTIIRPGHTYAETGTVLHSLGPSTSYLDRVRCGKPIVVHGDGNGLWSALHSDDVARAFATSAGNPVTFGRTYNATGEEWMTWNQYHAKVAQAMGVRVPPLVHIPMEILNRIAPERSAQSQRSLQYPGVYDTSKVRRDLGWQQMIPFVDGVRRTIHWLEEHQGFEPWQADADYDRIISEWRLLRARMLEGAGEV